MNDKITRLIEEAEQHTFDNNSYLNDRGTGTFSRPNTDFQAWIGECEYVLINEYGRDSAPWRIYERFNRRNLDGYYSDTFEREKGIIVSALKACLRIPPKSQNKKPIITEELDLSKVFIVHGHDELLKTEVARFIEKLKLEPIILHEQASSGKTIIEKIEEYSNVGFGIVLYTPCDIGAKNEVKPNYQFRARQNVVFEHGYLIGKIGRNNVCALVKGNIEKPNDISGVVYIPIGSDWKLNLAKEMRNSGYEIDMNLVI